MQAKPLLVYLPDTRGVDISRYGKGNLKIGANVYTYSRPAGSPRQKQMGTCPGATDECEAICYAKRIKGPVLDVYARNTGNDVPPIPDDATLLRIHISGDFDTPDYIQNWITRLKERPDVTVWAYTRSWRVEWLLSHLEQLRALPNVQLFASMDPTCTDLPPAGWRRAWIDRPEEDGTGPFPAEARLTPMELEKKPGAWRFSMRNQIVTIDNTPSFVCPEETGHKRDCVECGYCFNGKSNDVTFIEHAPKPESK